MVGYKDKRSRSLKRTRAGLSVGDRGRGGYPRVRDKQPPPVMRCSVVSREPGKGENC